MRVPFVRKRAGQCGCAARDSTPNPRIQREPDLGDQLALCDPAVAELSVESAGRDSTGAAENV